MFTAQDRCARGAIVSIEGISGVGKTHLTTMLLDRYPPATRPTLLEEFSQRNQHPDTDLGRQLLKTLKTAAHGDHFLQGGHPKTETLLLLAIKTHDFEAYCLPQLRQGRTVIEGRSLHTNAVYQSLILNPDSDDDAYTTAKAILADARRWRPPPDLTILIDDDVATAIHRAETRDKREFTTQQWPIHHRAAALFRRLADHTPQGIVVIDRRQLDEDTTIRRMKTNIDDAEPQCLPEPWREPARQRQTCDSGCRLTAET